MLAWIFEKFAVEVGVNFLGFLGLNLLLVAAFSGTAACGDKSIFWGLTDYYV